MKRPARYLTAAVLALLLGTGLSEIPLRESRLPVLPSDFDTLDVIIDLPSELYDKAYPVGFNYAVIRRFKEDHPGHVRINPPCSEPGEAWRKLCDGEIDLLIVDSERDSVPAAYRDRIGACDGIRGYTWAVRQNARELSAYLDFWTGTYRQSEAYRQMEKQFFQSYRIDHLLERNRTAKALSPYDNIFRKYAARIGWDWRLLAAVSFKESRFSVWEKSSFGAVGLMQIKPNTAAHYGVANVYDPDQNVQAAAAHLDYLQRIYRRAGIDSANVLRFTLAAYNAGEGRIEDCMQFTRSMGGDPAQWEEVAARIPLMSRPEYYNNPELIRLGKFNGIQTLQYIGDVLEIYADYRTVMPERGCRSNPPAAYGTARPGR